MLVSEIEIENSSNSLIWLMKVKYEKRTEMWCSQIFMAFDRCLIKDYLLTYLYAR